MLKRSAEHRIYFDMPFKIQYGINLFDSREMAILNKYGSFLLALQDGAIKPETSNDKHFVSVCRGQATPKNEYERIWKKYMLAKDQEKTTTQLESANNAGSVSKFGRSPHYVRPISPYFTPEPRMRTNPKFPQNIANLSPPSMLSSTRAVNGPTPRNLPEQSNRNPPATNEPYSRSTCHICGGDGGGGGKCYKCNGTGWA